MTSHDGGQRVDTTHVVMARSGGGASGARRVAGGGLVPRTQRRERRVEDVCLSALSATHRRTNSGVLTNLLWIEIPEVGLSVT